MVQSIHVEEAVDLIPGPERRSDVLNCSRDAVQDLRVASLGPFRVQPDGLTAMMRFQLLPPALNRILVLDDHLVFICTLEVLRKR